MKYIVILGDGMSDEPMESLGGRTPLEVDDYKLIDDTATHTYYRSLGPLVADCIKRYKERNINKV